MTAKEQHALDFYGGTSEDTSDCITKNGVSIVAPHYLIFLIMERVSSDISVAYLEYLSRFSTLSVRKVCTALYVPVTGAHFLLSVATSIPGLHIAWHLGRHI